MMQRKPKRRSARLDDALEMRDLIWELMRSRGKVERIGEYGRHLVWREAGFEALLRTPFQNIRELLGDVSGLPEEALPLPYGLDLWIPTGKVMNIEWDVRGAGVRLAAFRRGPWEQELKALHQRLLRGRKGG